MSQPEAPQLAAAAERTLLPATLHQWGISPFCYKVRMAAAYKGLRFTEKISDFATMQTARRNTGQQKVPVIETQDDWITDSTAIARWLQAQQPLPSLYPSDARAQADCALLEDWADEALNIAAEPWIWLGGGRLNHLNALCAAEQPSVSGRIIMRLIRPIQRKIWKGRAGKHGGLDATHALLCSQLDLLETRLGTEPWFFGAEPTIADFAVAGQLANLMRFGAGDDLAARPNVAALVERCVRLLPESEVFGVSR